MRELHVVAVSEDGRHVLLAARRGTTKSAFRVALDDRLLAAVRGDLPRPGEERAAEASLTPKEIQARLRAGESAASIAQSAGVPVTRVERFSGPVQGEMARMIDAARSAYLVRGRLGRSAVPLGRAVDEALAGMPTLREESVTWETFRQEDGTWRVSVTWFARARSRVAAWVWDPTAKAVTAVDPASAALAHVDAAPAPVKRVAKAPAKKAPAPAAKKAPARKAPAKKAPAKKAAATKPALQVVRDPAERPADKKDGVAARASVPAWADVLLGTSPGGKR